MSEPWLCDGFKKFVFDACAELGAADLLAGDAAATAALRTLRRSCVPGGSVSGQTARQLHVLHAAMNRANVHNGVIRATLGIVATGGGKTLIMLILARLLDILYGRTAKPMRTYVCLPLKAFVARDTLLRCWF